MPAVHIRDVPKEVLESLKQRAARHHRSLQGELRLLLESAAAEEAASKRFPPLVLEMSAVDTASSWSREDIYGDEGR
ncbi:MAG: Arc family DNA-binding protein [Acidobacteria bacterium]|nr:Arc family DNA-binding protein [Acidobacteriota bacterium]